MNDFFNPTEAEADSKEPTPEEVQEIRSKIQAEVFDGTPANFDPDPDDQDIPDDKLATDDDPENPESDSSDDSAKPDTSDSPDDSSADSDESAKPAEPAKVVAALSPEMQAIVNSINKLTGNLSGIEDRIKQTERRLGGISNEFQAAKEAAETQAKAPTPEEMAVAAKNKEAWEELKKDFPTWATAIKSKISAQANQFVSVNDFEALRKSVSETPSVDPNQLETRLVGLFHPDWQQITKDPAYATWLNAQDDALKHKAYKGKTAEDAIEVFNQFKSRELPKASDGPSEVEEIKAKRAKRLSSSTTTSTKHKTIKQKSEADMTDAEYRAHIAKEVFDN